MELKELEHIVSVCDRRIAENVRLNKEVLRKILTGKPERRLNREKIRAGFYVLSPFALCLIVVVSNIQFLFTTTFYMGLALFVSAYLLAYIRDVRYYLLLRDVDFSTPVISIKKKVIKLEKYKLKRNRIRYMLMPIAILGVLFMLFSKVILSTELILMLLLIVLVFTGSVYYTRYADNERFKALNREIEELEALEKE